MRELREQRVWAIWDGARKEYVSAKDGSPATADNLATWAEAAERLHWLARDQYPPNYSLAVSLDAAGLVCVSLLNAWDTPREVIKDGAAEWAATLDSWTEICHPS